MRFFGWGLGRKLKHSKHRKKKTFLLEMMPKNSVCAEIGVYRGELSEQILKYVKPKQLHLIDPWNLDQHYQLVKKKFDGNPCVIIVREKSEIALESFSDNFFDWVYIDGDHSTEAVLKDLKLSLKKVKSGGYIAGDDISFDEDANNTNKEVGKAVKSFLNTAPVELIMIKNLQYIMKVKK